MPKPKPQSHPDVAITIATLEQKPVVNRLMQLYLHDFSGFAGMEMPYGRVDGQGLFHYPWLDRYWLDDDRQPLLIHVENDLAGFVLLNRWAPSGEPVDCAIAEFFVLRKYRRTGIGTRVARTIFRANPGQWEVPIAFYNAPAMEFWHKVMVSLEVEDLAEVKGNGKTWSGPILRFKIKA